MFVEMYVNVLFCLFAFLSFACCCVVVVIVVVVVVVDDDDNDSDDDLFVQRSEINSG